MAQITMGDIGLLLCNRGKKDYVWGVGGSLGCLLVLLCPVIKVNGKLQQPKSRGDDKGHRHFRNEGLSHFSRERAKTC